MPESLLMFLTQGAPAAALLLAAMVLASLFGLFVSPKFIERCVLRPYWLLRRREYATLIGNGFVHADMAHLLFNAFTFWAFGFGLERQIGTPAFLGLYAVGLVVSDLGSWLMHRRDPGYATLGASGAILAVLFASIIHFPGASIFILPIPVPIPAPLFALSYLIYSYVAGRRQRGRVNHDAHLAGALAGVVFVALTAPSALARFFHHLID